MELKYIIDNKQKHEQGKKNKTDHKISNMTLKAQCLLKMDSKYFFKSNSYTILYLGYVLFHQGGKCVPCTPFCDSVIFFAGDLLRIPVTALAVWPGMFKGLGLGEGFALALGTWARLPE